MDESSNSDCVDQYGEPRILTQTGEGNVPESDESNDAASPRQQENDSRVDDVGDGRNSEENGEENHGLTDEISSPGDKGEEEEEEEEKAVAAASDGVGHEEEEEEEEENNVKSISSSEPRVRPPKKRSYAEEEAESPTTKRKETAEIKEKTEVTSIKLGDLVWGRLANACYYPAVVTMDHFKFFTKIVKAEPGFISRDPETGKVRQGSPDKAAARKQYHVQFLADNRRLWLAEEFVIAYQGFCR